MLGFPHDVRNMVFDKEAILRSMKKGSYLIDHTTSSPDLAIEIFKEAQKIGVHSIDAPVSGGDIGASSGTVVTMVGAEKNHYDTVEPLLKCYSKTVELMGGPGSGQHTKAANQIMIANNMVGVSEALIYSEKHNIDIDKLIKLLGGGAAGSFSLTALGPKMLKGDFNPGFYAEHLHKDLGIVV